MTTHRDPVALLATATRPSHASTALPRTRTEEAPGRRATAVRREGRQRQDGEAGNDDEPRQRPRYGAMVLEARAPRKKRHSRSPSRTGPGSDEKQKEEEEKDAAPNAATHGPPSTDDQSLKVEHEVTSVESEKSRVQEPSEEHQTASSADLSSVFDASNSSTSTTTTEDSTPSGDDVQEEQDRAANDHAAVRRPRSPVAVTENIERRARSVRFAETVAVAVVERDARSAIEAKWYASRDVERFGLVAAEDARRAAAALAGLPHPSVMHEDEVRECVGIESILCRSSFLLARRRKANHSLVILAMQAHHRRSFESGEGSAVALAELSERSSAFFRDRAASLAAGYWDLEKEEGE